MAWRSIQMLVHYWMSIGCMAFKAFNPNIDIWITWSLKYCPFYFIFWKFLQFLFFSNFFFKLINNPSHYYTIIQGKVLFFFLKKHQKVFFISIFPFNYYLFIFFFDFKYLYKKFLFKKKPLFFTESYKC